MRGSSAPVASEAERLRRLWRAHFTECDRLASAHKAATDTCLKRGRGPFPPDPIYPPFPEACRGMQCGARTRAGTPCKRRDIYRSGRCKLHGGLSTGPRTDAGKAVSAGNAKRTIRTDRARERTP